jgi:transposase
VARHSRTSTRAGAFCGRLRSGMERGMAAKIGAMDPHTLRDWVHRFNASGPEGLIDNWTEGPKPGLSA